MYKTCLQSHLVKLWEKSGKWLYDGVPYLWFKKKLNIKVIAIPSQVALKINVNIRPSKSHLTKIPATSEAAIPP